MGSNQSFTKPWLMFYQLCYRSSTEPDEKYHCNNMYLMDGGLSSKHTKAASSTLFIDRTVYYSTGTLFAIVANCMVNNFVETQCNIESITLVSYGWATICNEFIVKILTIIMNICCNQFSSQIWCNVARNSG